MGHPRFFGLFSPHVPDRLGLPVDVGWCVPRLHACEILGQKSDRDLKLLA